MKSLEPVSFKKGRASAPRISAPHIPGKHHARYWTTVEDQVIRDHYMNGVMACLAHLPNRARGSVYQRAGFLGLTRKMIPLGNGSPRRAYHLTSELKQAIIDTWPTLKGRGAVAGFAERLGLPRWWVSGQARTLGLANAHKKEPPWTTAEDNLLRKLPLENPDRCAEIFREHGFSRSPVAITVRSKRAGLHIRDRRSTFSGTAAATLLGMDNKTITQWCVSGDLKAIRAGTKRLPQQGGDAWAIEPADLRQFIVDNVARLDIRKVEKVDFIHLLVTGQRLGAAASEHMEESKQ